MKLEVFSLSQLKSAERTDREFASLQIIGSGCGQKSDRQKLQNKKEYNDLPVLLLSVLVHCMNYYSTYSTEEEVMVTSYPIQNITMYFG